jgi:Mrp family chromosome partitioning ATPase
MQMNNNMKTVLTLGAIAFALSGCGSSPNQTAPNVATLSSNTLQFAVGTANMYGLGTALNVVATYRQPNGNSGTLLNSPTITLPAAIPGALSAGAAGTGYDACSTAPTAPAAGETRITSTPQAALSNAVTSFGQSGGVYGLGIEPFNSQGQGDCTPASTNATGTPFQTAPYPVPLYDTASPSFAGAAGDPNAFIPWGGPPAFLLTGSAVSVVGSSNYPAGTAGVSEGIDVFAGIAPVASGLYTLAVAIPTTTAGTPTPTATFTLPAALTVLGAATAPAYVPGATGGGTFAFVMPALATEAYLQITDYGPATGTAAGCNGSGTGDTNPTVGNGVGNAITYTLEATASGTLTLPPALGPGGAPSVCTAAQNVAADGAGTPDDQISIQVVAFDYDLYHASYPASLGVSNPVITGAHASDNITISPAICQASGASCTAALPLLSRRTAYVLRK